MKKKEETHNFIGSYKYYKYGIEKIIFFQNDNFIYQFQIDKIN